MHSAHHFASLLTAFHKFSHLSSVTNQFGLLISHLISLEPCLYVGLFQIMKKLQHVRFIYNMLFKLSQVPFVSLISSGDTFDFRLSTQIYWWNVFCAYSIIAKEIIICKAILKKNIHVEQRSEHCFVLPY